MNHDTLRGTSFLLRFDVSGCILEQLLNHIFSAVIVFMAQMFRICQALYGYKQENKGW